MNSSFVTIFISLLVIPFLLFFQKVNTVIITCGENIYQIPLLGKYSDTIINYEDQAVAHYYFLEEYPGVLSVLYSKAAGYMPERSLVLLNRVINDSVKDDFSVDTSSNIYSRTLYYPKKHVLINFQVKGIGNAKVMNHIVNRIEIRPIN